MKISFTRKTVYKIAALGWITTSLACSNPNTPKDDDGSEVFSMSLSEKRPVSDIRDYLTVRTYAKTNAYTQEFETCMGTLKPGMRVMFSAGYDGNGSEAGQAHGVLVAKNDSLYYKQLENTTMQLLLPPGDNSRVKGVVGAGDRVSDWDFVKTANTLCKITFDSNATKPTSAEAQSSAIYQTVSAELVNFEAGTARQKTSQKDVLSVNLVRTARNKNTVKTNALFAKGKGVVGMQYRSPRGNGTPGASINLYVGDVGEPTTR